MRFADQTKRYLRLQFAICIVQFAICNYLAPIASAAEGPASLSAIARQVQPKVVKIYGAGGLRGLEAYQSGILISGEGHVLTVWSYVLDPDEVTVVLDDGRRFEATHVAADPLTEIALLKFDPGKDPVPHFDLSQRADRRARFACPGVQQSVRHRDRR